jgi:hypothetical protein
MSDPAGLEARLRAALGGEHGHDAGRGRGGASLDVARGQVLAGIRRRRSRRLQVVGSAGVVVLGLALSLPQVLGGATPSTQATGASGVAHSKSSAPAFAPSTHRPENASSSPALVAACHVQSRTVTDCGMLAQGSTAKPFSTSTATLGKAAPFGGVRSTNSLGSPLVVRAGTRVVVDLPRVKVHWRWDTPTVAGTPAFHGPEAPVSVRSVPSHGTTQRFLVATRVPATVVLEAKDDVFTGPGATPSIVAGSTPVWALELKVEGT